MKASELIARLTELVHVYGDHPVTGSVAERTVADIFLMDQDGDFTDFDEKPDSQVREYWLTS
ncbi:hypothetical protein SAMN05444007_108221 [Cribrihabitans marinus]|uniref:Uncharacterized protein n=1 Tax=Cribrihabitans marinus TaxID=1227549 RepID=A0A1H7CMZ4_9RHOB|nr:hypothetical protein [Cribrihabitans marinus]GGH36113.1 hypothetical protein GCM10010973_29890 [Cribrihabitans marinus]SEJ91068.1 hypothetical protein SAMN05444007_108221 [Cribrihabitans marinus]